MTREGDAKTSAFAVETLGERRHPSPLRLSTTHGDSIADFTNDEATILCDPTSLERAGRGGQTWAPGSRFELAGPRPHNYFRGEDVTAAIVTCGGLCPGLNSVIRGLVHQLWFGYGVRRILGVRYGFRGLGQNALEPMKLDPTAVRHIHRLGGTILGSSRGPLPASEMVDSLQRLGVNVFFCVGGDGTMRGCEAIHREVKARGAKIAVLGIPKTIDNDIPYVERTFGYLTAVSIAEQAISAAHVEAESAYNGIGVVKLMGRHSGYISAAATLASRDVNLVLVPELPFELDGPDGVIAYMRQRLTARDHAVVVVAEGAGQHLLDASGDTDASGNKRLADIGRYLRDRFKRDLAELDVTVKYIDPSYIIRAAPANAADAIFCGQLAEDAVHAAMAGKTGMVLGLWHDRFTHVPLAAVIASQKRLDLDGSFWRNVMDSTGQPALLGADLTAASARA
ncbi:MAG: ATP-dependent 6-phosphofructokinase [Myxococcales bacterium]|nr:ATP-dependent 6-phosphofructokinase [Myxococcales bacterium]